MIETKSPAEISRPYPLPALPPNLFYVEEASPSEVGRGAVTFVEESDRFDSYTYRLSQVIFSGKTKYQNVLIADTYNYDRVLVLDGEIQSALSDERLYHEMLVQPAMLRHTNPRSVLILGGGEGATLREVLVHASVKSVTMVDIDGEVVELCRQHLTEWHCGAFEDARVKLVFDDGRKFLENDDSLYDVVIIDIVDMLDNGPAQALYTKQFYELLRRRLRPEGIVVVQALEFSHGDDKQHAALARTLRTVFPEVHTYAVPIPSFLGQWGFIIASDWFSPNEWQIDAIDKTIQQRLGSDWLTHATGEYIKSRFVLCKETKFLLSMPGPILEDGITFVPPPYIDDILRKDVEFPIVPSSKA